MKQATASGKTSEEAIQSALDLLQVSRERVEIKIIDEGRKGIFGIFGSKRAVVQAVLKKTVEEQAENYLLGILLNLTDRPKISARTKGRKISFDIDAEDTSILIGRRGTTLNALQDLVQLYINTVGDRYYMVELDSAGYRERRKEILKDLAQKMAERAIETCGKAALEPMPSFERKWIHACLQYRNDVKTYSSGKEPHRHIVIEAQ